MASAAEKNNSRQISIWRIFLKAPELMKRIWFTLGCVAVYRLELTIHCQVLYPDAFAAAFESRRSKGVIGSFSHVFRGAVERNGNFFALGIMPLHFRFDKSLNSADDDSCFNAWSN